MTDTPLNEAAELTRCIETRYHALHRERLPVLPQRAEKIETVLFGENLIAVMRAGHDNPATEAAEIRRLTGDLTLPDGAFGTRTPLCTGLTDFLTDLEERMRLKNNVLFPQFEPS